MMDLDPAQIVVSLVVTLVAYALFPTLFSLLRKKSIRARNYRLACYLFNFFVVQIAFIILNGKSSGGPFLLWTAVFCESGINRLRNKGILIQGPKNQKTSKVTQNSIDLSKRHEGVSLKELQKESSTKNELEETVFQAYLSNLGKLPETQAEREQFWNSVKQAQNQREELFARQQPESPDYGYSLDNPILTSTIEDSNRYLSHLCTEAGEKFTWHRQGSHAVDYFNNGTATMVDEYELSLNGEFYTTLYICPYGHTSDHLPKGISADTSMLALRHSTEKESKAGNIEGPEEDNNTKHGDETDCGNSSFCRNCGRPLLPNTKFCRFCGMKILVSEDKNTAADNADASRFFESLQPSLRRAFILLEDEEWEKAEGYFEEVLDVEPENAYAYLGKAMRRCNVSVLEEATDQELEELFKTRYYIRAKRYADSKLLSFLLGIEQRGKMDEL